MDDVHSSDRKHISIDELFESDLEEYTSVNVLSGKFKMVDKKEYQTSHEDVELKFTQAKYFT